MGRKKVVFRTYGQQDCSKAAVHQDKAGYLTAAVSGHITLIQVPLRWFKISLQLKTRFLNHTG